MYSNDFFAYDTQSKTWITSFIDGPALVSRSHEINHEMSREEMMTDKPFYLAVMASRKQLQPILDNPHLFDPEFFHAVNLVVNQYNNFEIK